MTCANCAGEGWVCENHAFSSWPSRCACGAGMPCPCCNPLANANARFAARVLEAARREGASKVEALAFRFLNGEEDE